jgi:hypothetical protein
MPPAVVIFSRPGRQTIAQGGNDRAKTARGDFFIFLDADCIIPEPDRFFTQALSQFRKYPNLVALTAYLRVFPAEGDFRRQARTWRCQPRPAAQKQFIQPRRVVWRILDDPTRGRFTRLGGFRADFVTIEDADMFRRVSKIGKTMIDPGLTVLHMGRRAHQSAGRA